MKCSKGIDYHGTCLCKDYVTLVNKFLATPQKGKKKKSIEDFITFTEKKAIKKVNCIYLDTKKYIKTLNTSVERDIRYHSCKNPKFN